MPDSDPSQKSEEARWARVFKALGHPQRYRLYLEACLRPLTVSELVAISGRSQPAVSQYLNALRRAGLVRVTRKGRNMIYESVVIEWSARRSLEALGMGSGPVRDAGLAADSDIFPEMNQAGVPATVNRDGGEDFLL